MSNDLEEIFSCIFDARVPPLWEKVTFVASFSKENIVNINFSHIFKTDSDHFASITT